MDAKDFEIIRTLQVYGRLSNQDLADRVNLSPSPCLRRVRMLEKAGILQGYGAVVDAKLYGLPLTVFLRIRLQDHSKPRVDAFEKHIASLGEVMDCYLLSGDWDYMLRLLMQDLESYERFVRTKMQAVDGIGAMETTFAYGTVKSSRAFPPVV